MVEAAKPKKTDRIIDDTEPEVDIEEEIKVLIYREIARIFEHILKFYDLHQRQIGKLSYAMNKEERGDKPVSIEHVRSEIERVGFRVI